MPLHAQPLFSSSSRGRPGPRSSRRAFTLLEILVVLALVGLLTGVLVVGANRMLSRGPATPEQIFWETVDATRRYALQKDVNVRLSFDEKARSLVPAAADGAKLPTTPLPEGIKVEFLSASTGGNSILLGGERVETSTVPAVTFYSDGTCSPFRVQLRGATGVLQVLEIDPWTCAPVLREPKT